MPLEFDLAIGVRKTDAFLKYMLEFALDDKKDEIEKILRDYGVPLVQCSKCVVPGDLPAHGSYIAVECSRTSKRVRTSPLRTRSSPRRRSSSGWMKAPTSPRN